MKIGITASSKIISNEQLRSLKQLLIDLGATEMHHGDCIVGDWLAHRIGRELGLRMIGHPPDNPKKRAFCDFDEIRPEKPYLERNRDIVDETDVLIGMPDGPERLRSGTWSTIRYGRKTRGNDKVRVIFP